jgi:hypothetical protein
VSSHFDGLVIPSKEVVDGVAILRQPPFSLIGVKVKDGHLREVAIDVTKVSVKMSEVAEWYERYVAAPGVQYDENHGETAYKFFDEGILRLIARPETTSVNAADGRILPRKAGPPRLPHPQAVAGLYGGVKPLFADRLAGRRGGVLSMRITSYQRASLGTQGGARATACFPRKPIWQWRRS